MIHKYVNALKNAEFMTVKPGGVRLQEVDVKGSILYIVINICTDSKLELS